MEPIAREAGEARFLEPGIVIGVEVVDAYDGLSPRHEGLGDVVADESGCSGYDDAHNAVFLASFTRGFC